MDPTQTEILKTIPSKSDRSRRRRAQEVLDAVATVFVRKGFRAAATQDVAELLGIQQASVYYRFEVVRATPRR